MVTVSRDKIEKLREEYLAMRGDGPEPSVEPKNGGPRLPEFFAIVGSVGTDRGVYGTVITRLRKKKKEAA